MVTQRFACPECGKEFDSPRRLQGHRIHHKRAPRPRGSRGKVAPAGVVKNAVQASEIVKTFCEKMNPGLPFSPTQAVMEKEIWRVKVNWGFLPMVFEVSNAGQILSYYRERRISPGILP